MAPCSVYAVFLVFSLLCTAHGKPHAELKCNLYADAKNQEDHGRKQLPRSKESAFLLRVIPTEESANFQYRVELHATESGQKFQQFLIQAVHPTYIGVSDFQPLIKGAGFFTNASNEWEPITCQTANDSAVSTSSILKEHVYLTWETPSGHIPTMFWCVVQDANGNFHSSTHEINLFSEEIRRRMRRSASSDGMGPGLGHCTYDVPDSDSERASCIGAGYDQCCPGENSSCQTGVCYCDEACFHLGDCCRDINELNCTCNKTLPNITSGLSECSTHATVGDSHTFTCRANGVPIPNIVWLKDGSVVDDTNLSISYSDPSASQVRSTLEILEVSIGHHGTYTCLATNNAGSDRSTTYLSITEPCQEDGTVRLVDRPSPNQDQGRLQVCSNNTWEIVCDLLQHSNFSFLEEPHDSMGTQGGAVTFSCEVSSNLDYSITWLHTSRNGTTSIVNSQASRFSLTATNMSNSMLHSLRINLLAYSDAGNYTCVAIVETNSISSSSAYLSVFVPAQVQEVNGTSTVIEFETLVISCKVLGHPLPMVRWSRNGESLDVLQMSTLGARISTTREIHTEGEEVPFVVSQLRIVNMTSSDGGIYQCSAENGYPPNTGHLSVSVLAIDDCQLASVREGTMPCQNGGSCLDSVHAYHCLCAEGYTGTRCTEAAPRPEPLMIVASPPDTPAPLATELNLTCNATGNPPPTYSWYRDGRLIPGAVLPYLYIAEATPENRGYYRCEVMNNINSTQSTPALVTIPGVYQYSIEVELNNQSTFEIDDLPNEIAGRFVGSSNISLYSVQLLSHSSSKWGELLFTVIANSQTTAEIPEVIAQELRILPLNLLSKPQRYDGCPAKTDQIAQGIGIHLHWNESEISSHLSQPCPCKDIIVAPANATISRRCGGTYSEGASWDEVDYSQCHFTSITLKLCEASLSAGSSQVLAEAIATITTNFTSFESSDVSVTATLIGNLTQDAIRDPEVTDNYLNAIDNLLQANSSVILASQMQSNSSARLLESLTVFSDNVLLQNDSNSTIFTRKTFALLVEDVDVTRGIDETLYVNLGTVEEATNTSERIDPNSLTKSSITANMSATTTAEVRVPQSVITDLNSAEKPTQRLAYTVFTNDSLFQSTNETQNNITLGSIVISVQVNASNDTSDLPAPIQVTFLINALIENASTVTCAAWNADGVGLWLNNTCTVTGRNDDDQTPGTTYIQAEYRRPGHFGMLLDLNPSSGPPSFALQVLTYIGLTLSLVCLAAFIVTYMVSKNLRNNEHGQILINMSFSLIGFYVIFLIGGHAAPVPVLCGISAAFLQYFMLVYFGWTAAEAVYLYRKLVKVLGANIARYVLKAALIVWLAPLLIVAVSAGAGYNYYDINQISYCRAEKYPFWFGLVLPFVALYIFNWIVFFLIMWSIFKLKKHSAASNKLKIREKAIIAIGLATVLGLGWGFGLLATSSNLQGLTLAFQIIFSIFVGCQGLFLFILHGVRSAEARKEWKLWYSTISDKSMQLRSTMLPSVSGHSSQTMYPLNIYEMSDVSKESSLRWKKEASMSPSVGGKQEDETTNAKKSPTRKQSLVQKAMQVFSPSKHDSPQETSNTSKRDSSQT